MSEKRDEPIPIRVSVEVTSDGRFLFVFPSQASYAGESRFTERVTQPELEFLVRTGATYLGWEAGSNLSLNFQRLPTRQELERRIDAGWGGSPFALEPGARRAYVAVESFRAYASWLPDQHRIRFETDIKFLERRLEELYMYRGFIRSMRTIYKSQIVSGLRPGMIPQMWQLIRDFAGNVFEAVGIDLWNEKDDNKS